jgi:hypothetical protein
MNGSLDTRFGENRSLYMAQVVKSKSRYPRNGVTMNSPRQDVAGSKQPNFKSFTPKVSGVKVDPCLLVKSPPGRTRQKVSRSLGNVSRRVAVNHLRHAGTFKSRTCSHRHPSTWGADKRGAFLKTRSRESSHILRVSRSFR